MRVRWLARLLLPILVDRVARARAPDFRVVRANAAGDDETYLRRWFVVPRDEKRWFNVYLHNMVRDDDAVLHDHPYWSVSLVLTDGLLERYCRDPIHAPGTVEVRRPREGDVVWRSSKMAHQLVVEREAWTLFVTGPRRREWGFWCPGGWRPWHEYVKVRGGSSTVGAGCGEQ